ncbi:MAG: carboxymuconolactone decarboxylase family protein [Anaerolineae bacterium]|nr:carboxymuconolactone decarboxylase family protein [Anaerolineae bacterium]
MSRIIPVNVEDGNKRTHEVIAKAQSKYGNVPPMMNIMVNSPSLLDGYIDFSSAMVGTLPRHLRELIAVAVAEYNRCPYCLASHVVGAQRAGVPDDVIFEARQFRSSEPRSAAILTLARLIVTQRGHVTDQELAAARAAGLTEKEIVEVVGIVVLNIFTNYFNILAETEPEHPIVPFLTSDS